MRLRQILIADPVESVAQHVAMHCERLAEERTVALTSERALALALSLKPQMFIVSLELTKPETIEVVREVRRVLPDTFVVVTFRELAVPTMERLDKLDVDDFMPQPIDFASLYRVASTHFNLPFRRHDRHAVSVDVMRADRVVIGRTVDLSEGGMMVDAHHPLNPNESMLVELNLPNGKQLRVRCHVLEVQGQPPTPVKARIQFDKLRSPEHQNLVDFLAALPASA